MRFALFLVALVACGPITYVTDVTQGASTSLEKAKAAQADKWSPYYYTRAKEYLHAAREDVARADFQGANRFGKLAKEAADTATKEALLLASDPSKRPKEIDTTAPAKAKEPEKLAPVKE